MVKTPKGGWRKYLRQWIIIKDDRVVGSAEKYIDARKKAEKLGIKTPLLFFVDPDPPENFMGI